LHNYNQINKRLPPAALYGKDGTPLLSWRVLLLPYLEQQDLFKQFKLDEPWDGPHNRKLLEKMPNVYAPVRGKPGPYSTFYQVFDGPGAVFQSDTRQGLRPFTAEGVEATVFEAGGVTRIPSSFPGGTSRSLLLAEAGEAVPWTKPADLHYDPGEPLPALGGQFNEAPTVFRSQRKMGTHVLFADGSVQFLSNDTDEATLRELIAGKGEKGT
jgi:prepilin-type processing-associated H-X9-DG protein